MTDLRTAAQQALEALEGWKDDAPSQWSTNDEKLITALRAALEQPEPGGACARCGGWVCDPVLKLEQPEQGAHESWCASLTRLLTSHPPKPAPCNCNPPRREWRGLTEEEIVAIFLLAPTQPAFARAIEQALRSKNDQA